MTDIYDLAAAQASEADDLNVLIASMTASNALLRAELAKLERLALIARSLRRLLSTTYDDNDDNDADTNPPAA